MLWWTGAYANRSECSGHREWTLGVDKLQAIEAESDRVSDHENMPSNGRRHRLPVQRRTSGSSGSRRENGARVLGQVWL